MSVFVTERGIRDCAMCSPIALYCDLLWIPNHSELDHPHDNHDIVDHYLRLCWSSQNQYTEEGSPVSWIDMPMNVLDHPLLGRLRRRRHLDSPYRMDDRNSLSLVT